MALAADGLYGPISGKNVGVERWVMAREHHSMAGSISMKQEKVLGKEEKKKCLGCDVIGGGRRVSGANIVTRRHFTLEQAEGDCPTRSCSDITRRIISQDHYREAANEYIAISSGSVNASACRSGTYAGSSTIQH